MRFLSYVLVAIVAFVAAIAISNGDFGKSNEYDFSDMDGSSIEYEVPTEYTTYYNQLSTYQKTIYDAIFDAVKNKKESLTFSSVDTVEFGNNCYAASLAVQYDHPELFWFTGGYSYSESRTLFENRGEIVMYPTYYSYASSFFNEDSKGEELSNAVKQVADLARSYSSDTYDRIVFVHDYIIQNAIYDYDGLEEYYKSTRSPSCEYIFSAYGCLVNGKTVCSGYAKAFMLVMKELGVDCTYVVGDAGEKHGWNCVYLDGEGYYVDVTWDDLDRNTEVPKYDYALIDSKTLSKTHTVEFDCKGFEDPVCNSEKYNYFHYYGYYLDRYDYNEVSRILSEQSHKGYAYIRFGSMKEAEKAYEELIKWSGYKKIPGLSGFSEQYVNDEFAVIGFIK